MLFVTPTVALIETLAWTYTKKGSRTDKWTRFTADYMPASPDLPRWYGDLRSQQVHHLSAGSAIQFTRDPTPRSTHGNVTASGGTVVHVPQFISDTGEAFFKYRRDVLADAGLARQVLAEFDKRPPVRETPDYLYSNQTASAAWSGWDDAGLKRPAALDDLVQP